MNSDQDLRAKFTLAEKLFLEKKTQESINLYREILSINPNIIPAINNLGAAYESLNNFFEAEKYYLQCFNFNQEEIVFINNLANIFLKQRKFDKAIELFKKSLKIQPQKKINKNLKIFIQINIGNETQKSGIEPSHLENFYNKCVHELKLNIIGLMCIPPQIDVEAHFVNMQKINKGQFKLIPFE